MRLMDEIWPKANPKSKGYLITKLLQDITDWLEPFSAIVKGTRTMLENLARKALWLGAVQAKKDKKKQI